MRLCVIFVSVEGGIQGGLASCHFRSFLLGVMHQGRWREGPAAEILPKTSSFT